MAASLVVLAGCNSLQSVADPTADIEATGIPNRPAPALQVPPDLVTPSRSDRFAIPGAPAAGNAPAAAGAPVAAPAPARSAALDFGASRGGDEPPVVQGTSAQQAAAPTGGSTASLPAGAVLPAVAGVQMVQQGQQSWLVADAPADAVWLSLQAFLKAERLEIEEEDPKVGVLQTRWSTTYSQVENSGVRGVLSRVLGSAYSTGARNAYRFRLDRLPGNRTQITVTQRGMEEVVADARDGGTVWQPRPNDPGLEVEILRRLALSLGTAQPVAQSVAVPVAPGTEAVTGAASGAAARPDTTARAVSAGAGSAAAAVTATPPQAETKPLAKKGAGVRRETQGGVGVLRLDAAFDSAWRSVGEAMERLGFTIEDRDRSAGIFYIRHVDLQRPDPEQGLLSKVFSGERRDLKGQRYRVVVASAQTGSAVGVRLADGTAPATTDDRRVANEVVALIEGALR